MRLLPVSTGLLTTAALSLWPAAILASADARTLSDLRGAAVAATVLAGIAAAAWRGVAELKQRDRRQGARERALIRAMERQLDGGDHPSGPFRAVR